MTKSTLTITAEKRAKFASELKADGHAAKRDGEIVAVAWTKTAAEMIPASDAEDVDPAECEGVEFAYLVARVNADRAGNILWMTPMALTTKHLDAIRFARLMPGHIVFDLETGKEA